MKRRTKKPHKRGYISVTIEDDLGDGIPPDVVRVARAIDLEIGMDIGAAIYIATDRLGYAPLRVVASILLTHIVESNYHPGDPISEFEVEGYRAIQEVLNRVKWRK